MPDKKISELDAITGSATAADDFFIVVDSSGASTNKISRAELNNAIEQDVLENISITNLTSDLNTNGNDIKFGDNDKAIFGAGSDLQIYHDGSHSYITENGVGNLYIQYNDLFLQSNTGENYIYCNNDAQVTLYYDNSPKLSTTASGIDVQGSVTADGLTVSASLASADLAYFNNTNATASDVLRLNTAGVGSGTNILDVQSGGTTRFLVRGDGNVGIGTSAPSYPLEVHRSSGQIIYAQADSGDGYVRVDSSNAGSEAIFWARATTTGYSTLQFGDPDDSDVGWIKYQHSNNSMAFRTNGIEHMRIDNVGNLHVGKTVTGIATAGLSLRGDVNVAQFTRDGGDPLNLNRLTSDGDIIGFYKDGTIVGSIGNSGTQLTIDSSSNLVLEANSGASNVITRGRLRPLVDNTDDIGSADRRFKDLYLSGGVYLGGTGAANKLDDYEEGAWVPTTAGDATGAIAVSSAGQYTKIGRFVHIQGQVSITANFTSSSIGGLPFTPRIQSGLSNVYGAFVGAIAIGNIYMVVTDAHTNINMYSNPVNTTLSPTTTHNVIRFAITYETDA